jgi:undecaprenyl-diphosphatase
MLHVASLLVIILVFWKDILDLLKGIFRWEKEYVQYGIKIIIASIPIAIVGILFEDYVDAAFSNLLVVGICLLITSIILLLSKFPKEKRNDLTNLNVVGIGIAQAFAILPGISRSGSTISSGLGQGIKPKETGRFAFLIAIPAIAGAAIFKIDEITQITEITAVAIGCVTCFVVGIISLKMLLKVLNANKIHYFAPYCVLVGILCLILYFG